VTPRDVAVRVLEIDRFAGDDERQHARADKLWRDVLHAIATGACDDPRALAAAALTVDEIGFARWCS
jgi:hypothetical protein